MSSCSALVVSFPGAEQAIPHEVGGKGYALIRLGEANLPVPPGVVLTTKFFAPWIEQIKASQTWAALIEAEPNRWSVLCDELKNLSRRLALTRHQQRALKDAPEPFMASGAEALLAVRSSAPDEDLASASFAGIYSTRLGLRPADLEAAVRDCLHALVLVALDAHAYGNYVWGAFFGLHCFALGVLLFKAGYFPKALGVLMILTSFGYLLNSFGNLLVPGYEGVFGGIVGVTSLLGEFPFVFWLLLKGVDANEWNKRRQEQLAREATVA